MAYKRFRRFRRYPKRKGKSAPWYAKKYSVSQMAQKALKGVNYIRGLVNSEMYKLDTAVTGTVPDSGSVTHVTAIPQGDGEGNRSGNSVYVRSLNWKGQVFRTTSGNANQTMRIIVFCDNQQITDSSPGVTDLLQSATVYSHLNKNTVGRFSILANKVFMLSSTGDLGKQVNINIPLKHHVRYNGSATGDIARGGLYVLCISDQASTNYPSIQSEVRVSYHDN